MLLFLLALDYQLMQVVIPFEINLSMKASEK